MKVIVESLLGAGLPSRSISPRASSSSSSSSSAALGICVSFVVAAFFQEDDFVGAAAFARFADSCLVEQVVRDGGMSSEDRAFSPGSPSSLSRQRRFPTCASSA